MQEETPPDGGRLSPRGGGRFAHLLLLGVLTLRKAQGSALMSHRLWRTRPSTARGPGHPPLQTRLVSESTDSSKSEFGCSGSQKYLGAPGNDQGHLFWRKTLALPAPFTHTHTHMHMRLSRYRRYLSHLLHFSSGSVTQGELKESCLGEDYEGAGTMETTGKPESCLHQESLLCRDWSAMRTLS